MAMTHGEKGRMETFQFNTIQSIKEGALRKYSSARRAIQCWVTATFTFSNEQGG